MTVVLTMLQRTSAYLLVMLALLPGTVSCAATAKQGDLNMTTGVSPLAERDSLPPKVWLTGGGYLLAMLDYGYNAWWHNRSSNFRVVTEDWFGADSYRGGTDKLGHAYFTYLSTRLLQPAFSHSGLPARQARNVAAGLVIGATLTIEILDGYTPDIGFSFEDVAMDLGGVGLALWFDSHPRYDERFDFRLRYLKSADAQAIGESDPFEDYSGQIYMLVAKLDGFPALRRYPALRYLEVFVGYGTSGYRPERPAAERERAMYAGISLNLARLLDVSLFRNAGARTETARRITHGVLELLHIPGNELAQKNSL